MRPHDSPLLKDVLPTFDVVHGDQGWSAGGKLVGTQKTQSTAAEIYNVHNDAGDRLGLNTCLHVPAGDSGEASRVAGAD